MENMALTDKIASSWNYISRHPKETALTGALLFSAAVSSLLPGCSSQKVDYADVARKEQMLIDRIQQLPTNPIEGVTYDKQSLGGDKTAVLSAKFTYNGVNYVVGGPFAKTIEGDKFFFAMIIEDGQRTVKLNDWGSGREMLLGTIDGQIDTGSIQEKDKHEQYNRYWVESTVKEKLEKYEIPAIETALKVLKVN
jgi:hypothetical protein